MGWKGFWGKAGKEARGGSVSGLADPIKNPKKGEIDLRHRPAGLLRVLPAGCGSIGATSLVWGEADFGGQSFFENFVDCQIFGFLG